MKGINLRASGWVLEFTNYSGSSRVRLKPTLNLNPTIWTLLTGSPKAQARKLSNTRKLVTNHLERMLQLYGFYYEPYLNPKPNVDPRKYDLSYKDVH